jgi:large subunit ribosomal protein L23
LRPWKNVSNNMAFNLFKKKQEEKKHLNPVVTEAVEVATPSLAAPANAMVLKRFFISEKSTRGQAYNHYTFVVASHATKSDVKHAVQRAYKVAVTDVNMVRLPSKTRRVGRWQGTKSGIKKAIVTLKEGQVIAQAQP